MCGYTSANRKYPSYSGLVRPRHWRHGFCRNEKTLFEVGIEFVVAYIVCYAGDAAMVYLKVSSMIVNFFGFLNHWFL